MATVFQPSLDQLQRVVEVSASITAGQAVIYDTPVAGKDRVIPATNVTEPGSNVVGVALTSQAVIGGLIVIVKLGVVPGILTAIAPPATAGEPFFLGPTGNSLRYLSLAAPPVSVVRLGYAANSADLDVDIEFIARRP